MDTFEGTTFRQKLIYLSIMLIFACQNPIANEVPFLFYRSDLECLVDGEWRACKEQEICENGYEHKFVNTNGITSISMTQDFVCTRKLIEATIIFLGPIAQMFANFLTILYEIPKSKKFGIIYKVLLLQGISLMCIGIFQQSLVIVVLIWIIWNFVWSYYFAQVMYYIEDILPKKIYLKTPEFMNIVWPIGGLIFVSIAFFNGSYVFHCVYMIGMPVVVTTLAFYFLTVTSNNQQYSDLKINSQPIKQQLIQKNISAHEQLQLKEGQISKAQQAQEQLQAEIKQKSFIHDLVEKFKELLHNKVLLKNLFIYMGCWVIQMMGNSATFIAFNSVGGVMKVNVFISVLFELSGTFLQIYLMKKYDAFKILYYNFLITGLIQTSVIFNNSGFVQMLVIGCSKISNKVTFAGILMALNYLLPQKFIQLAFSLTNIVSILANSSLPFYKYYMDLIEINFFFGLGILSLISVLLIKSSTIVVSDPKAEQNNQDHEINKKISDSPSRKISAVSASSNILIVDKNVIQ
ncbi:hypothetical protein ABPG74_021903 [Tetrahymena malaccensis]